MTGVQTCALPIFAGKLSDLRGPGGRRTGWDIGLDYAKEFGLPLMQTVSNLFAINRGGIPAAQPGAQTPAMPAGFDPYHRPDLARQAAQQMAQQPQQPVPQGPPAPPPFPPQPAANSAPQDLVQTIRAYGGIVIQALNAGQRGCDFADSRVGLLGAATHAQIANYGPDTLLQSMMTVPEIALFGEPKLRTFAFEFCHYDEILQNESEEGDPEGASVTA